MMERNWIFSKEVADRKLKRMALEIAEKNYDDGELILIGIKDSGTIIAKKIAEYLKENYRGPLQTAELSINKKQPDKVTLSHEADFNGKTIILIDDVANSGRTMLYALKPLLQHLPRKIQTLALVERSHKQFPVAVDYVGLSVSTTLKETIVVDIIGGEIGGAYIIQDSND